LTADDLSITVNTANGAPQGVVSAVSLSRLPAGAKEADLSAEDCQLAVTVEPPATLADLANGNAFVVTYFDEGIGASGWSGGTLDTTCTTASRALKLTSTHGSFATAVLHKTLNLYSYHGAARLRFCIDDPRWLWKIDVYFVGPTAADYYACTVVPNTLTHGENDITIRLSDCLSTGSPAWDKITRVQLGIRSHDTTTSNVTFRGLYALNAYKPASGPIPVMFTFDDSNAQVYTIVAPKLAQHGWAGTANITASQVDNIEHLTTNQILDLQQKFGWSFAYHGCNHIGQDLWASTAAVDGDYDCWFRWMQDHGIRPTRWLSYPGNYFSATSVAASRHYFYLAHNSQDSYMPYWGPNFQDMRLPALSLKWSLEILEAAVDSAITDGSTLIFYCDVFAEPASGSECSIKNFNALVDYLASKGGSVKVMTADDYIKQFWP
jgi:hypothetical protein